MQLCEMIKTEIDDRSDGRCDVKKLSKIIVYYAVHFALILLLCVAVINTLVTYNKWPIYTEVLVIPQNEAKYPAITMCPITNGYKEHVLQVSNFDLFGV